LNLSTRVLVASCLTLTVASFSSGRAAAQITLTPRIIQIDQIKCSELQSGSDQRLERLLVYFNGYVDGMRRTTTWDEREVGALIDRVVAHCNVNPGDTILSAFTRASR
jgi:hypothetical protein